MVKLKHKRVRAHIIRYLEEVGSANIIEIEDHLNSIMKKHQPSIYRLMNILARGPEFEKVGKERVAAGPRNIPVPEGMDCLPSREVTVWELGRVQRLGRLQEEQMEPLGVLNNVQTL